MGRRVYLMREIGSPALEIEGQKTATLEDIEDINFGSPLIDGDLIVWDDALQTWTSVPQSEIVAGGAGGDPAFVSNVDITGSPTLAPSATGTNSIAVGSRALADATDSIVIGTNASADGSIGSIMIGKGAGGTINAGHDYAISIGAYAIGSASQDDTIVIGRNAESYGGKAIAIGGASTNANAANGNGNNAIAIGYNTVTAGTGSISIGEDATTTGNQSTAIGRQSAAGTAGLAIGYNASADTSNSIAIGSGASVASPGYGSVAVGMFADGDGDSSTAVGERAEATGTEGVAIGYNTLASAANAVAIGPDAEATNIGQISFATGSIDHQTHQFFCHGQTTDGTSTIINPDGGTTNRMIIPASTTWRFRVEVAAEATAQSDFLGLTQVGTIRRDGAGNTLLVGTVDELNRDDEGSGTWTVVVTADDTTEALQIEVTGEGAHTINWTAAVHIVSAT